MTKINRISNYNPKMINHLKQIKLMNPFDFYSIELRKLIDQLLYQENISKFLNKEITKIIDLPKIKMDRGISSCSWMKQVIAKHASSIARSIQVKVKLANNSKN